MMEFSASFDPASLAEIAQFAGIGVLLDGNVQSALSSGAGQVRDQAVANTQTAFRNPSGQLASTIAVDDSSPFEKRVVVGSPYGHRREKSFKGPDSLGRMFPNDPAEPYLEPALVQMEQAVMADVEQAVLAALGREAF